MAVTIWKNFDKQSFSFSEKTWIAWWSYPAHAINHGKHGYHTMIMPWIITTMPKNTAAMPSSWHDHDHVLPWSRYDHDTIMAWKPCFSNPGRPLYILHQNLFSNTPTFAGFWPKYFTNHESHWLLFLCVSYTAEPL